MPHDRNGNVIEVGDVVRFDAKVQRVFPVGQTYNANFEITSAEENKNYRPQFSCNTTLCGKVLAVLLLLMLPMLDGCASMKGKTIEEQKATLNMWTEFAKENRLLMIVQASHDGTVKLFEEAAVGVDAGATVTGTFLYDPDKGAATKPNS